MRLQLELPIRSSASYGLNTTAYFVTWSGLVFEPFVRFYEDGYRNDKGSFVQLKMLYGLLSSDRYAEFSSNIFRNTDPHYGAGLAAGRKYVILEHFSIEIIGGVRFLTQPKSLDFNNGTGNFNFSDGFVWYISNGMPIDFQVKFGIQL
ncbi:MAG: hypothetical protein Q8J69_04560 [Sphingobacteriaceae bacterium]|nr:hypothetical protein [Sphingobacteriaceae bacterium]